jgi:hypothetical protein
MRWTRRRQMTNAVVADGEAVWSWRPDAGVKFSGSRLLGDDGGKKARSPGRARNKLVNHRAGKAGLPPLNLYARVRFFVHFCTRDRGCSAHPAFPAPSCSEGGDAKLGRIAPRERGRTSSRCLTIESVSSKARHAGSAGRWARRKRTFAHPKLRAHFPGHDGLRFSPKALRPSLASSVIARMAIWLSV